MKAPDKNEVIQNCKITDYLGIPLGKKILSPFRSERTPSFHVFTGRNGNEMFMDHGAAVGDPARSGDIIKLHMLLRGVGFNEACHQLMNFEYSVSTYVPASGAASGYTSKSKMSQEEIAAKYGIRSNQRPHQSRYVQYTGLPIPEWIIEAFGLYTDTQSNLCIPTSGGIHCKGGKLRDQNKTFALNVGAAGVSIGGNLASTTWYVVEGIGDLLALIDGAVGPKHTPGRHGYICTNSTSNVAAVIDYLLSVPQLNVVHLYLDKQVGKDHAADRDTAKILAAIPAAVDCRDDITTGKDLRDLWDAKRR